MTQKSSHRERVYKDTIALIGFGDIARRLAPYFEKDRVLAVKRTPTSDIANAELFIANANDAEAMDRLFSNKIDVVVMSLVPTEMSDLGYQQGYVDSVRAVIEAVHQQQQHQPRLIVFVSSTSVYGQQDSSWVDENSLTEPTSYSGKRLLEAEHLLQDSGLPYCCVRFSGIYGPGRRRLIEQVIAGYGTPSEPVLYSNRIHADDGAKVLAHIIQAIPQEQRETVYLATDGDPAPLHEVKQFIAAELMLGKDHLNSQSVPVARMLRSSKRCSNQRLINTGYSFIYPTFREGYSELLQGE